MKHNYQVGDLVYEASIYDGMNTSLTDLPFYQRWLPKTEGARILELCCGTGRLILPLAQAGYNISGLDYTASMLAQAKRKAAEAGLEISLVEADMRTFELPYKYDLIFIPFNSIHHLYGNDDLFKALSRVKDHLKADGCLLFDCFNPNLQFVVEGAKVLKHIAQYTLADGREVVIKEQMRYESQTQVNRIEWHYFIDGTFDSVQNLDMRLYFPQELDAYLSWSGFKIVHKFGSFAEDAFTSDSDKQIFVCELS